MELEAGGVVADAKPRPDFFISYASVNRRWAEWIAVELEKAGYTTIVQSFDFQPGTDFVHQMQKAATTAERTIAVLSPAYFGSQFVEAEWRAAFANDPSGERRLLIPVRVQPCSPPGLLATRVYVDLVGTGEAIARRKLLAAVDRDRPRPTTPFPGEQPEPGEKQDRSEQRFPGLGATVSNLPARNRTFSGRGTALLALYNGLQAESAAAVLPTTAVHGLGGVGKTALALEFAHRYASDYDLIWWINAEQQTTAITDLVDLGNHLGLPQAADQNQTIKQLFRYLRSRDRWLLVYDNAESPTTLNTLLPAGGGGHILITSRWSTWAQQAADIPLDVLVRQESVDFLRRRASTASAVANANNDVLAELANLLGDLPLALDEAAAYLDETHVHPIDYVDLLRNRARELFDLDNPGHDPEPGSDQASDPTNRDRRRVAAVWTVSLDKIGQDAPAAEALLTLMAFLAADMPRMLPAAHAALLPQPLADTLADPITYHRLTAVIGRYSLASATPTHLGMHRLVQTVIRNRLTATDERAWATTAINVLRAAFPNNSWDSATWPDCEQLLPHLIAVTDHVNRLGIAGQQAGSLLDRASTYLRERGQYHQAKPLAEQALATTESAVGADHLDTAWRHDELGRVLRALGDLDAARLHYEQALRIGEAALGPEHPDVVVWRGNLGIVLHDIGDFDGARHQHEQALRIGEAALGPNHLEIGIRRNNLGTVLRALGDLNGARHHLEQALRIGEAALGPDHPTIATWRGNLGTVLRTLGDLNGARHHLEQALRISEAALGPDHPTIGISRNKLGRVLYALGDLDGARHHFEQALRIGEATLEPDHPRIATWRGNLGTVLRELGDLASARHQHEQALRISEAALGAEHPRVRSIRAYLSELDPPDDQPHLSHPH